MRFRREVGLWKLFEERSEHGELEKVDDAQAGHVRPTSSTFKNLSVGMGAAMWNC